jgi:thiol-disulfide isomerase/thioredoxin
LVSDVTGVLVLVVTLVAATGVGLAMRSRNGRLRSGPAGAGSTSAPAATGPGIDLRPFGVESGARATLLQFSSAFCAPCRATRATLSGVAGAVPGVRHVEVDVADGDAAMDLVRRLDIRRTPTTLVLDAHGQEVRRASGVPRRDQVLSALSEVTSPSPSAAFPSTSASGDVDDVR